MAFFHAFFSLSFNSSYTFLSRLCCHLLTFLEAQNLRTHPAIGFSKHPHIHLMDLITSCTFRCPTFKDHSPIQRVMTQPIDAPKNSTPLLSLKILQFTSWRARAKQIHPILVVRLSSSLRQLTTNNFKPVFLLIPLLGINLPVS